MWRVNCFLSPEHFHILGSIIVGGKIWNARYTVQCKRIHVQVNEILMVFFLGELFFDLDILEFFDVFFFIIRMARAIGCFHKRTSYSIGSKHKIHDFLSKQESYLFLSRLLRALLLIDFANIWNAKCWLRQPPRYIFFRSFFVWCKK